MYFIYNFNFCSTIPLTSTENVQIAQFRKLSLALQITWVCPISNRLPDCLLQDILGRCPELSLASGLPQTTIAVDCPNTVELIWLFGQDNIGASIFEKVNLNLPIYSTIFKGVPKIFITFN